ncbi:unnamed protein product [Bursaphelenchus xylophilus]|uniref:(pine wood nematode) hypothetical protein n=1 Tax=Bursaphelenchus xylophilus TaxID=6326 RepID=A0A1I7SUZ7_BURXY|nr:unnamed protein product [Bursaphelenchus xylophilus]CAG9100666.1 unnamed protein product [Bursaphelenchus xylophilus]
MDFLGCGNSPVLPPALLTNLSLPSIRQSTMIFNVFLLLLQAAQVLGSLNEFTVNLTFSNLGASRTFIVDSFRDIDFVLSAKEFRKSAGLENTYDQSKSKGFYNTSYAFQGTYKIEDNFCDAFGYYARDTVALIPNLDIKATFGVTTWIRTYNNATPTKNYEEKWRAGRLAFAQTSIYNTDPPEHKTILENTLNSNNKGSKIVCLHISVDDKKGTKETAVGINVQVPKDRVLGTYQGNPEYNTWHFDLTSLKIGGKRQKVNDIALAYIDTANPKLQLPAEYIDQIVQQTGAKYNSTARKYIVDCKTKLNLEIELNMIKLKVRPDALIHQMRCKRCELLVEALEGNDTLYLGVPLLVDNGICLDFKTKKQHLYNATYSEKTPILQNVKKNGGFLSIQNEKYGKH